MLHSLFQLPCIKLSLSCLSSTIASQVVRASSQAIVLYMKIGLFPPCCITLRLLSSGPAVFLAPVINYLFLKTIAKQCSIALFLIKILAVSKKTITQNPQT